MSSSTEWPPNWRRDYGYLRLYDVLVQHHGRDRADRITLGKDAPTNRDKQAWANLGRRA